MAQFQLLDKVNYWHGFLALCFTGCVMADFWALSRELKEGADPFGAALLIAVGSVNMALWWVFTASDKFLHEHRNMKWFALIMMAIYAGLSLLSNTWLKPEAKYGPIGDMNAYAKFNSIGKSIILLLGFAVAFFAKDAYAAYRAQQAETVKMRDELAAPAYKEYLAQKPLGSSAVKAKKPITFRR
jgi:hypothetical protein